MDISIKLIIFATMKQDVINRIKSALKGIDKEDLTQAEKEILNIVEDYEADTYPSDEPRFSTMDLDEETNIPDLQNWVDKRELVGVVDEEQGGIIGYVNQGHADMLYTILNDTKHKLK